MPTATLPDAFNDCRLLTIKQVVQMTGFSRTRLHHLMKDKKDPIPRIKIGKSIRFRLDKVLWWIEKHEE